MSKKKDIVLFYLKPSHMGCAYILPRSIVRPVLGYDKELGKFKAFKKRMDGHNIWRRMERTMEKNGIVKMEKNGEELWRRMDGEKVWRKMEKKWRRMDYME